MSTQPRIIWFDANRVFAAIGVVLLHSSTDFRGQSFIEASTYERLAPVFLRSVGAFSGSEMFFLFSLFLMAMRTDKHLPSYFSAISLQAKRLLIPFAFWVIFYAFFRLIKANAFNYESSIWEQLTQSKSWFEYFLLGNSQYHMHFLPTLFMIFLFFPLMRLATRYPALGLTLFFTLGVMNSMQAFIWGLDIETSLRLFILRGLKIFGYVGYGFAAFAIYGIWKDGIPRGESRLLRRGAFYFAALAYIATLPVYWFAIQNGSWGVHEGWSFYGHFLMPVFIFFIFLSGQYLYWSPTWSNLAPFTFGVYLVHPLVIDIFDITLFKSGVADFLVPGVIVLLRFLVVLPLSFLLVVGLSRIKLVAWTIGLGPTPWALRGLENKAKT